jgi:hypothetical protein
LEGGSEAEQELSRGWKPVSPDPWKEVAEPRTRRIPRAKVSAAAKGSVPVTLGDKLPPVSVLARREFGLRMLRR